MTTFSRSRPRPGLLSRSRSCLAALLALPLLAATPARATSGLAFVDRAESGVGSISGLNGVRALAMSPDGMHLYAASDKAKTLTVFGRDDLTGALVLLAQYRDGENGVDGLDLVRGVTVSPDGTSVYATGERDDAIAVFARDPLSGLLTFVEVQRDGVGGVDGLDGAKAVVVSPDLVHVYAAGSADDAVAVFGRDPGTGALTFVEVQRDGVNGVSSLRGAEALAISGDGLYLYVAASGDDAITVFACDPDTGALTVVERHRDNVDGEDGLDGVHTLALSPDGLNLYAGGKLDDAIAVYAVDPGSGMLTFMNRLRDNVDGVDGLDGIEAIAPSPDGSMVYAVSSTDDAIAVFDRSLDDGSLTFRYRQHDGVGTLTGLTGPKAIVPSLDGYQIYVAAADTDSLLTFSARCGDGFLDPGEQCDDGNVDEDDGCSSACRLTCQTAADCNDGNPCTEDRCRLGECALPECGVAGAVCALTDALPAFSGMDACLPLDRSLGRLVRLKLREARHDVQRLGHRKTPSPSLVSGIDHVLRVVPQRAARLEAAGRITSDCRVSIQHTIDALSAGLDQALLRHGICAN